MKKKKLLLNWVYYRPVGHVVEALKLAKGYTMANKDVEVHLLLNSESPVELGEACSWIKKTYSVSLKEIWKKGEKAKSIQALPKQWDYIITDSRVRHFKKGWDESDLMKAHKVLDSVLEAKIKKGFQEQVDDHSEVLSLVYNPKISLTIPKQARKLASRYRHKGPAICIMLGGSAGDKQSPTTRMWLKICQALVNEIPNLKIYFTGVTKQVNGRTATLDFSLNDVKSLVKKLPNAEVAYNIGLWNQLALIEKCDIFLSPHTGFAFLPPLIGTPWLELGNCRWPAYIFNYIPFYSVLPDCGYYPALGEQKKGCGKLLSANKKALCMTDKLLEKKIPEIAKGAKLLLDKSYTYDKALTQHLSKIRKDYDISDFFFLGGLSNLEKKRHG
jgi:hypothetical protein